MLLRSPLLLAALVAYPIVIALLVGLVAGYASSKPRVAFVDEDGLPPVVAVGGHRFHLRTVIVATTLPDASSRDASSGLSLTSVTSFATWSMTDWMWKLLPATVTTEGSPSSSTNATRGFELA